MFTSLIQWGQILLFRYIRDGRHDSPLVMSRHFRLTREHHVPLCTGSFSINRLSTWVRMHLHFRMRGNMTRRMVNVQTPVVIVRRWLFNSRGEQHGLLSVCSLIGSCHHVWKWHVWWWMFRCQVEWAYALSGKHPFFLKSLFISQTKGNYSFLLLFLPACVVPLTFLSTWVTIYSQIRVGDCTLQEDWFYSICAGFSISTWLVP